jgi:hypothetical protein
MLCLYGGIFLSGLVQAIKKPDLARIMGIEMSKGLMKFIVIVASLLIVFGFAMLSSNLLAMASVLQ